MSKEREEGRYPPRVVYSLLAVFLVVLALNLWIFRYFLVTAAASASVAILLSPVYERLCQVIGMKRSLAAAIVIVLTALVILVPLFSYGVILGRQAVDLYEFLRPRLEPDALRELWNVTLPARYGWFRTLKDTLLPEGQTGIAEAIAPSLSQLASGLNRVVQRAVTGLASTILYLVLFLLTLFFFLRDSKELTKDVKAILPFSETERNEILLHVSRTVKGVLYSMVIVPVVQGLLAMLGFKLFGMPSPLFWGTIVIFAAVIPGVGAPAVWLPAAIYLFFAGSWWQALGLLLFGTFIIGIADNIIKPLLLHGTARIHTLLAFLAILGGLLTLGPVGFLIGPVVLSLLLSVVRIYRVNVLRQPAET